MKTEIGTIYIDIGSTQIKLAEMNNGGSIVQQTFYSRDYSISPSDQVSILLKKLPNLPQTRRICSSANGGIRVGIISLTSRFSGAAARNLALGAGANIIFINTLNPQSVNITQPVDTLIFIGGIDCEGASTLKGKIASLDLKGYNFKSLIYAGNRYLASFFLSRFPQAVIIPNPFVDELEVRDQSLLTYVRNLYLEDLIDKDSIRDLTSLSEVPIIPTPGIVNIAFERLSRQKSKIIIPLPCIVIDIGGATTDIHFGVETLKLSEGMDSRLYIASNRYVFTDLGVVASRSSTLSRLSNHTRLYEFLQIVAGDLARQVYIGLREGEVTDEVLFYGCFFLALDELSQNQSANVPVIDLNKLASIMITGGASQVETLNIDFFLKIFQLLTNQFGNVGGIRIILDYNYELWVDGIASLSVHNLI